MGTRANHLRSHRAPDANEHLSGAAHLVNPKRPPDELGSDDEVGERHYVGRLLKVADAALQTADAPDRRKRRKH